MKLKSHHAKYAREYCEAGQTQSNRFGICAVDGDEVELLFPFMKCREYLADLSIAVLKDEPILCAYNFYASRKQVNEVTYGPLVMYIPDELERRLLLDRFSYLHDVEKSAGVADRSTIEPLNYDGSTEDYLLVTPAQEWTTNPCLYVSWAGVLRLLTYDIEDPDAIKERGCTDRDIWRYIKEPINEFLVRILSHWEVCSTSFNAGYDYVGCDAIEEAEECSGVDSYYEYDDLGLAIHETCGPQSLNTALRDGGYGVARDIARAINDAESAQKEEAA